jgi:hypothetical protein
MTPRSREELRRGSGACDSAMRAFSSASSSATRSRSSWPRARHVLVRGRCWGRSGAAARRRLAWSPSRPQPGSSCPLGGCTGPPFMRDRRVCRSFAPSCRKITLPACHRRLHCWSDRDRGFACKDFVAYLGGSTCCGPSRATGILALNRQAFPRNGDLGSISRFSRPAWRGSLTSGEKGRT